MKKFIGNKDFYKLVAALALPLLLQNAVSTFVNLLDNLMVGRIGTESMSGVSIVNQLLFVYNLCLFGGTGGAGIFGAQFFGRGDYNGVRHTLRFNILLCAGFTVIATVLLALIPDTLIGAFLHEAGTGGDLALTLSEGKDYLRIMLFGLPAFCLTTAYVSILRVTGDNRLPMKASIAAIFVNLVFNYLLIYGKLGAPMLGCAGAAVATLISRAFEVAVLCVYAAVSRRLPLMPRALLHPGRVIAKDFAKYALPVVCNECLWSLAFSLYTVIMGHMDNNTPILSAYTIAGNLQRMMTPASFAAGGAAAVLIGREIGRGTRGSVQRKAWVLDALALVVGFVCMGIIALVRNVLLRPYILPLMHMEGEACDIAMYMMGILMLVQPVSSVSLTNIVGVLRGGGDVRYAMLCDVGPLYAVCLPLAALAALVWKLDIRYVYPLMSIDVIVQIFLCFPRLRSGRWIHDVTRGAGELEA